MSVKTKEEIIQQVTRRLGETPTDEDLALLEDVTDTLNNLDSGEDWKTKYEENDKAWRQKYRDRFMSPSTGDVEDPDPMPEPTEPKKYRYEDLFKEG